MGRKRLKARKAGKQGLASGAGSAHASGLAAPEGFLREHVLDVEGRASTVIRRIDNLYRLRDILGADRVNSLMALRMASEAMERGLTPRCGLDMSPGSGPDGFLSLIEHRISASLIAGQLWGAVPEDCMATVRIVVLQGGTIDRAASAIVRRKVDARLIVHGQLERSADAIGCVLDARFGRPKMRVA